MTKAEIASLLQANHKQFLDLHANLSEQQFTTSVNGKWNPSQELDHIIRAVSPVVLAFSIPQFILKFKFGKSNRPSKTYDGLVEKYHTKLAQGGQASGQFIPKGFPFSNRAASIKKLESLVKKLIQKANAKSDGSLEGYILPHPLLGKLTLREMLYFTAYHVEHHRKNTLKNLEANTVPS